jgi:hypothetical protein
MVKLVNIRVLGCPLAEFFFSTTLCIAHDIVYNINCVNLIGMKSKKITLLFNFHINSATFLFSKLVIWGGVEMPHGRTFSSCFWIVFFRLWYELTYVLKKEKSLSDCLIFIWTKLTKLTLARNPTIYSIHLVHQNWYRISFILYTNKHRTGIWLWDGSQITTISATYDDLFLIHYILDKHFKEDFLAISIPSFF